MLSVILISPNEGRRRLLAQAFAQHHVAIGAEIGAYPNFDQIAKLIESDCDVVVVDLDEDPDVALNAVENICSRNSTITVMACSRQQDPGILVQCMRSGAREFLSDPISAESLAEAVVRASARRLELEKKKVSGRILAFCGAKGGTGATTLASNFAIVLKEESGSNVALVDLKYRLGDVSVVLGIQPAFTIVDALNNESRLDQDFLATLLSEHRSGVAVLAAPDQYTTSVASGNGNLRKILYILRDKFPYVVVDAGTNPEVGSELVCEMADIVYLVTQAEIPHLRNAERLISFMRRPGTEERVHLVLNRYDPRRTEFNENRLAKALSIPVKWKVPNDYASVSRSLNTGVPLASGSSAISKVLREMAREVCGRPVENEKRKKWGFLN